MKSKSEIEAFADCIKRASGAYIDLARAQTDCNILVDAELDLLANECDRLTTVDKASIKKIAKALASDKADAIKRESKSLANIVADFFNAPEISWEVE